MKSLTLALLSALACASATSAQLTIPPKTAANTHECFNSDGDGASCNHQRSGSWITGNSDGEDDVAVTDERSVIIPTGSFQKHIVDYRVHFNQSDAGCEATPIVETPHHAPFVLEFSRTFRTRASYVDYGMTKGWKDNYFFLLNISSNAGFRSARFEVPSGPEMNWIDIGATGNWTDDNAGLQSMVLALTDEPGDKHLVTDRWGGKYHFVPNTGARTLQYLCDWLEDENGNRITLSFDVDGYPTLATDGFGRSISYAWATPGFSGTKHLGAVLLPNGQQLALQYFFDGQRTYKLTYANGEVASYGFGVDGDGQYYYFNDPLGEPGVRKQRVYTYAFGPGFLYDTGRVRGIKDESGHVQLIRSEAPLTPTITIEYDNGRAFSYDCAFAGLNEVITNLRTGAVRTKEWQANGGLLKKDIDPDGHWVTADYDDDLALRVLRHNLDGSSETWSHNALNRVADYVDPNGNLTHHDYDVRGNLLRTTFADGSYREWTRDGAGRPTSYRNRDGKVTNYTYDARGNVAHIVLPAEPSQASPVLAFTYDVDGRVQTKTDPLGRVTQYAYDGHGRRVLTLYPDGTNEQLAYGAMNLLSPTDPVATAGVIVQRTDRNGNVTTNDYGVNDNLVREADALGETLHLYDAQDRLVGRTQDGDSESYAYDSAYRRMTLTRVVDATHTHVTTYQYDILDRVILETDPHGFTTQTVFTPESEVAATLRQIDGLDSLGWNYTYDFNGNRLSATDGLLRSFEYDSNDRLVRAYDPAPFDANYVEVGYDNEGHTLSRRDQSGNTTFFGYTNRGLLGSESDPTGVIVTHEYYLDDTLKQTRNLSTIGKRSFSYDSGARPAGEIVLVDGGANDIATSTLNDGNGNVLQRLDGEGFATTYQYDARNRLVRVVDPLGAATVTTYFGDGSPFDARLAVGQGSAVGVTDEDGNTTTSVYDGIGRVLRELDATGASTVFTRDVLSLGRVGTLHTNRLGKTSAEYFDGLERLVQSVDELSHATGYTYDVHGNLLRVDDAAGHFSLFTSDSLGRCILAQLPEFGDNVSYSYFANGLVAQRLDQKGNTTQYAYDSAGRLLSKQYQDGSLDTFTYDFGGRLIQAQSQQYNNVVTRAYDRADRIVRDSATRDVLVTYDRRSLETSISTPSGRVFQHTYTARGELDTVKLGPTVLVDNAYGAAGDLTQRTYGNGATSTYVTEAHGWTKSIQHARGASDILSLRYLYDAEGRKLEQRNLTNAARHDFYQYDDAGRLVFFRGKIPPFRQAPPGPLDPLKGASKSLAWTLDAVGNWSSVVRNNGTPENRLHSASNQLVGITGLGGLQYDKNGNLVRDDQFTYSYDFENRLKEIRTLVGDDPLAAYTYDALGRRVQRTAFDKAVIAQRRFNYNYLGERLVELREQPTVGQPDIFLAAFVHGTQPDQPLVMVRTLHTYYFHHNSLGSTAALTNESGAISERYEYDPYGRTQLMTGVWQDLGDTSAVSNPFTFQGRENDSEAGLIYFRGRHLSAFQGRYIQRNPAGYAGGINLYSAASLVNGRSPFGLDD